MAHVSPLLRSTVKKVSPATTALQLKECLSALLVAKKPFDVTNLPFFSHRRTITKMTTDKPNVVFVLGAPGSGKGTQCQNIVDKYGYVHLSAGDLLRAERRAPGSEYGELIEHHITNGTIVPVAITCSLLQRAMKESGKSNFLIDGFPRNKDNLDGWNQEVGSEKANVRCVLFFTCEEKTCVDRCLIRGATSGRSDDNEASLRKRFVTYLNATMPIIDEFRTNGLVREIDANRSIEEVFVDVAKTFDEELK